MTHSNHRRKKAGFTIAELLLVVAILSVVLSAVTMGVTSAMKQYRSAMRRSQTDILYSTLHEAITAELRTGTDFVIDSGTKELKSYHSQQMNVTGSLADRRINESGSTEEGTQGMIFVAGQPVVGQKAYQDGVKAYLDPIVYDENQRIFTVKMELKMDVGDGEEFTKSHTFCVSPLNLPE